MPLNRCVDHSTCTLRHDGSRFGPDSARQRLTSAKGLVEVSLLLATTSTLCELAAELGGRQVPFGWLAGPEETLSRGKLPDVRQASPWGGRGGRGAYTSEGSRFPCAPPKLNYFLLWAGFHPSPFPYSASTDSGVSSTISPRCGMVAASGDQMTTDNLPAAWGEARSSWTCLHLDVRGRIVRVVSVRCKVPCFESGR